MHCIKLDRSVEFENMKRCVKIKLEDARRDPRLVALVRRIEETRKSRA